MPYQYETRYAAKDGNGIYLTIDSTLQYSLEKFGTGTDSAECAEPRMRNNNERKNRRYIGNGKRSQL